MLRVALTGGLGSGKSTVAAVFRRLGAEVMSADEVGRAMMQPGQVVYQQIVRTFGRRVVTPDGTLDRRRLGEIAFCEGRIDALNAIVHPAVIAEQQHWMDALARERPETVAVYETALLYEASRAASTADWQQRFDRRILVTAPEALRVARFIARIAGEHPDAQTRMSLEQDARRRMAAQMSDDEKARLSDTIISNDGSVEELTRQAEQVYRELHHLAVPRSQEKERVRP
jgi:dephospho-CoA kinase